VYQIRLQGELGQEWTDWFGGLQIVPGTNGETILTGPIIDQAALYGVLRKVRDLGLPLLAVGCVVSGELHTPSGASNVTTNDIGEHNGDEHEQG